LPSCLLSDLLFYTGIAGLSIGIIVLLFLAQRLCKASFEIRDDLFLVKLGRCGRIEIPLGSIKEVKIVENPGKGMRIAGIAVPRYFYSGRFRFKNIGEVFIYADKPHNLLLVETIDGKRLLFGYGAAEMKDLLEQRAGKGPVDETRIISHRSRYLLASLLLSILSLGLAVVATIMLPEKLVFAGEVIEKGDALLLAFILGVMGLFDVLVFYAISQDDPVTPILSLPSAAASTLIVLSILLAGALCPA
jgi:hypothetical protein